MNSIRNSARLVTIAASVVALGAGVSAANASAQTFHGKDSFDPTGDVFTCSAGDLTVTGGIVNETFAGVQDNTGTYHFTDTIVPKGVTLTDGANTYYLSGTSWFGQSSDDPSGDTVLVTTTTDHFVIRDATGGVYAKVSVVEHMSPDGGSFVKDSGACEEPAG